ncbi:MAG: caspase family protein [Rhodospirillaceae bacterium]|nr:caspase family protein [Rhodospirillaceae bacterium]MBT6220660.1 caspase family protein [Rhodospirillaceae bacterium]MBT6361512.1 caspase family protein [Rhodospirillaceae bacterium]
MPSYSVPRLTAMIVAIIILAFPCLGAAGNGALWVPVEVAQFEEDDEPEDDNEPALSIKANPLQVCTREGCVQAAEKFSNAEIMSAIYGLLKHNERSVVKPCESEITNRNCTSEGFSLFVLAGILPANANLAELAYKDIRINKDNTEITLKIGITGSFLGASANCGDLDAVIRLNAQNNPVLAGKESFYCNWLAIGNIFWSYTHVIDFVDFAKGTMGGPFEFSAIGLLTAGGADGYGQHNLTPANTALLPGSNGTLTIATKVPTAPPSTASLPTTSLPTTSLPTGTSTPVKGVESQLAALKGLHDKGLIDDVTFQAQQRAILSQTFGNTPAPRPAAQQKIAPPESGATLTAATFGRYHALVIGNNDYRHLPKLRTAVNDASTIAAVLQNDYGYLVTLLLNATRANIIESLDRLTEKLVAEDNLLIYYAGHGWLDESANRGYWLATDAKPSRRTNWVSNATLTDTLKTIQAKHVMVVADSCFSGTLTRGVRVGVRTGNYWNRMAEKITRVALVSGGLEPVSDGIGKHSPFAKAFISALQSNDAIMDGTQLFNQIRRPVMIEANQTPQYTDVRQAGHEGGDFLFVRRR